MSQMNVDPIRAAAAQVIREALRLRDAEPNSPRTIHQVRVCTKKLRAYLRVYSGNADIRKPNRKLKVIADAYSGARDAYVLDQTLEKVISTWSSRKRKKYQSIVDHFKPSNDSILQLNSNFDLRSAFEGVLLSWPHRNNEPHFWATGLDLVFIKTQKLGIKAQRHLDDEAFHAWRKWVKYWLYGLSDIGNGKVPSGYQKSLKRLAEALGYFHDLCVLEDALIELSTKQTNKFEVAPFLKTVNSEKKSLKKYFKKANKGLFNLNHRKRFKMVARGNQ